jgi:hypothetical protein
MKEDKNSIKTKITAFKRTKLVEWMLDLCTEFKLLRSTLYLAIDIVDRFISSHNATFPDKEY